MFIARPRASCGNRSSGPGQNQGPIRRPAWRDRPGSAAENPAPLPAAFAVAGQIADPASVTAHSPLVETSGLPVALPRNFEALGATKSDRAPSAAAKLLQHADANVRAVAGCARATIGGRSALAAIRPLLGDARPDVRKAAIVSAGWLKDELTHLETPRTFRPEGFSPDITFALAKATDPSALDVFRDGRGGREPFLREPSRRAIAAIEAQTLASMAERHRAPPFTAPALAQLQRAGGKDDRALKGSLFEGDSPPVTLAADAKFGAWHDRVAGQGRQVFDAAACTACPRVEGGGGQIGPDLTTMATKEDRACPNESVLDSAKRFLGGDQTTTIRVKHGQTFFGFLRGETARGALSVRVRRAKSRRARATSWPNRTKARVRRCPKACTPRCRWRSLSLSSPFWKP
jgi:hypothetical protein